MNRTASPELVAQLVAALEAADLYLNSFDTSAPSRIKAETRGAVESAIGAYVAASKPAVDAAAEAIKAATLAAFAELPSPAHAGLAAERAYLAETAARNAR